MQHQLAPPSPDDKYYVDHPYSGTGFETLSQARCHAGTLQRRGSRRSVRIYLNGECVDYKRY